MPQNDYTSLTTPQLHTANERNRRKWNRADAATRNSNAVGDGFGVETTLDGPKDYYTEKRDRRAVQYVKSQEALAARKEPESDYGIGSQLKDSFIGASKPIRKPFAHQDGKCTVM